MHDPLTVTSLDGTAQQTIAINVTGSNDGPIAVADIGAVTEDTPLSGNVLANDGDVDGPALTVTGFSVAGVPASFAAGSAANIAGGGTLVVDANDDYSFT